MRVLIYCAAPKADGGGVQAVVLDLARWLRDQGHEVVTAWPDGEEGEGEWRLPLEAGPGLGAKVAATGDLARLAARLHRFRPDVVNVHFPRGQTLYFTTLKRVLGYRLVLSVHNSDVREPTDAVRAALSGFLTAADAVTAVSNDLVLVVNGYRPGTNALVIPNGVDTAFWTPGEGGRRDPSLAVAAGRLLPMKGFDLLLPAFARGAPGEARLVIAGEGEDRAALEAQADALGLAGRIEMPGLLSKEALRDLYRRAGLFVLSSRREGMPLALLEAMACGAPAVATAVNGVPDVMVPACGETVQPEDEAALAAAIGRWLGDADRQDRAGLAARTRAEEFSAEQTYARYEAILGGAAC